MRNPTSPEERRLDLGQRLVALLPKLRKQAEARTRSSQAIDDLVQDTCAHALANLDKFRSDGRFDGWISTTLHNIWLQGLRKKRQRGEEELPDPDLVAGADFQEHLSAKEMVVALGAEISSADVLLLMKMRVYRYTSLELAEEMGVPADRITKRVSRAVKALRKAGWTVKGPPE